MINSQMTNGRIISRTEVSLNKNMRVAVSRMYNSDLCNETTVERLTYISDGLKVKGYIAQPTKQGPYPVLLWNRGGSGDRGALDDLLAYLILASTAQWGYVVLATQYRGNMGSEGSEDWGGDDIQDSLNLLKVAEQLDSADMSRLGIEGASRGGMTTYRALLCEDRFRCAIVHAGLVDLVSIVEQSDELARFIEKQFGHLSDDGRRELLRNMSAVHFAERLPKNIPILLVHGDNDRTIPIVQSESMVEELSRFNIPHLFERISGAGHVALKDGSYRQIDLLRKSWLKRHLA
ncbi:MAG: alpha/beta hydrolase family protein [Candidatus Zixiibacteriota bacterium]